MPIRTITQEFCDLCWGENEVEIDATNRLRFSWQGSDYVLLACDAHVSEIRDTLQGYSDLASPDASDSGRRPRARQPRSTATSASVAAKVSLFSQLDAEDKERFRAWAGMPTARRIADRRVKDWVDAGKP